MYVLIVKSDFPTERLLVKFACSEGIAVVQASTGRSTASQVASPPEESSTAYDRARNPYARKRKGDILRDYFFNDTDAAQEDAIDVYAHVLRQKLVEAAFRKARF